MLERPDCVASCWPCCALPLGAACGSVPAWVAAAERHLKSHAMWKDPEGDADLTLCILPVDVSGHHAFYLCRDATSSAISGPLLPGRLHARDAQCEPADRDPVSRIPTAVDPLDVDASSNPDSAQYMIFAVRCVCLRQNDRALRKISRKGHLPAETREAQQVLHEPSCLSARSYAISTSTRRLSQRTLSGWPGLPFGAANRDISGSGHTSSEPLHFRV